MPLSMNDIGTPEPNPEASKIVLVGAGVVGRAILKAHVDAGVSVCLADLDANARKLAVSALGLSDQWQVENTAIGTLPVITLTNKNPSHQPDAKQIVIESIAERLDIKQAFFREAEQIFGDHAILCSNTSTLRIESIAQGLSDPSRVLGMHFFMPVGERPAVEIVQMERTHPSATVACEAHVRRIGKSPIVVADGPGFIVNRLLSPYLNQSLLLLAHGVDHERIKRASENFGMPMSPLELIDFIGTRTMFDAGRAYWQAFPSRIDPSPIVPALVKSKRLGRSVGCGIYDYVDGSRSSDLPSETKELCEKYHIKDIDISDDELTLILAIPMWIESALALEAGVAHSTEQIELAMKGGLGYQHSQGWYGFFQSLGESKIDAAIDKWGSHFKSMRR